MGNLSKYQVMVVSKCTPQLKVGMDSCSIESKDELKLAGVTVGRDFHLTESILAACKKTSLSVGVIMMRMQKLIPEDAKLRIFQAAIQPYLTYCGLVWHFCGSSDSKKLE